MATADYSGIIAAVVAVLKADTVLTDPTNGKLAIYAPGQQAASRSNSIFYENPPTQTPPFPCITVRDLTIGPGVSDQHELPMSSVWVPLEVSVWGRSQDIRAIQGELDLLLESAWYQNAMDTTNWEFQDIDTADQWHGLDVPAIYLSGSLPIEQRAKTFAVKAANKTI